MRIAIAAVIITMLLSTGVSAYDIQHTPPNRVFTGDEIPLEVRLIDSFKPIDKVEIVPSYSYDWYAFELVQATGDNHTGLWIGIIPAQSKAGYLYYTVDILFEDGSNSVVEYSVKVYSNESEPWITLPDSPLATGIAAAFLIVSLVALEVLFRRRFFGKKKDDKKGPERKARKIKKKENPPSP